MADHHQAKSICIAINEARKEAIEECAKRAQQKFDLTIDKQSILSLIKELK